MLQNYITGSYYRIILRNDINEVYYGIIFMKRIPGMPRTSLELPGAPGIPWARPWEPRGRPWDPRARLGPPGDVPETPGTPLGPPRDAPKTPRDTYGPQKMQYLDKYTAPEALDCCV